MHTRSFLLVLVVPVLAACPGDSTGDGHDETGDSESDSGTTFSGEPEDPLDDAGAEPPGEPDLELIYPSPTTLGDGLVYDTRYLLGDDADSVEVQTSLLGDGVPWELAAHETMLDVGFRPAQIHADIEVTEAGSTASVAIEDDSIYISDDDANYLHKVETYIFSSQVYEEAKSSFGPASAGFRPVSIDVVNIPGNVRDYFGFSVAWVYDESDVDWAIITPRSKDDFDADVGPLLSSGYRPISMSSRLRAGTSITDFAAILVDDGMESSEWTAMIGLDVTEITEEAEDAWDAGFYPFSGWTRNDSGANPEYNLLWTSRPPPAAPDGFAIAARYHMTDAEFATGGEDATQRSNGMHLLSADRYVIQGQTRYAAVWAKYPPYMRSTGTAFSEMDQDYLDRYKPFHDQVLTVMDNIGTPSEGEFFRPSATLHIFDGDQLVLNRAYTYAPALYPDTEVDAAFKLASVSKSLTAAAIVREFDDLSTPFVDTISGWSGTSYCGGPAPYFPTGFANVTIDQILQHQGGLVDDNLQGINVHSQIVTGLVGVTLPNADGQLPIDGEELLYYLGESQGLCALMDPVWDPGIVDQGTVDGSVYSNLGYYLLGEVLQQSVIGSYEGYVSSEFFDPLSIESISPDPDHRYASVGPSLAAVRAYLLNDDHPYLTMAESIKFGLESPPVQVPSFEPQWSPSANPDVNAPAVAIASRYGGGYVGSHAVLPAGGWFGNGADLGLLLRDLVQDGTIMSTSTADQLWHPSVAINSEDLSDCEWDYGRGFYLRGNWVAMAGGTNGSAALVMHDRAYDFTVVVLTNAFGNLLNKFANELFPDNVMTMVFPCVDETRFGDYDECELGCEDFTPTECCP